MTTHHLLQSRAIIGATHSVLNQGGSVIFALVKGSIVLVHQIVIKLGIVRSDTLLVPAPLEVVDRPDEARTTKPSPFWGNKFFRDESSGKGCYREERSCGTGEASVEGTSDDALPRLASSRLAVAKIRAMLCLLVLEKEKTHMNKLSTKKNSKAKNRTINRSKKEMQNQELGVNIEGAQPKKFKTPISKSVKGGITPPPLPAWDTDEPLGSRLFKAFETSRSKEAKKNSQILRRSLAEVNVLRVSTTTTSNPACSSEVASAPPEDRGATPSNPSSLLTRPWLNKGETSSEEPEVSVTTTMELSLTASDPPITVAKDGSPKGL
ncbi:uncharacterized protein G2W53_039970 [Senna tora]|uniref:Uncharacterized protein n=1 Tax=Senna tora TaxID=362788 RepID=A0A834T242_9FABA|nr:uncharacterized protein G2W53_039970 [Senna tora]